ncbi:hypothetical protein roselon_00066 [Roseibacterium elongatum DSM 19469]|uniref:Uncharacterized protein n=1 Tax=Roseicyclus elongatus DSM 19469 TaxID=1294273 RepID=W8RNF5_9RHOB|nr:hypothetical protein roselon_00066 [Roseibacterium elongatum DSM 19469]
MLAILIALVATALAGLAVWIVGVAISAVSQATGGAIAAAGMVLTFSVMFSWAGHLPGALILHALLARGWGGWLPAMAGGLAIGAVLLGPFESLFAVLCGPLLALFHLAGLRWMARLQSGPSGR